jgi:hypothetical protein
MIRSDQPQRHGVRQSLLRAMRFKSGAPARYRIAALSAGLAIGAAVGAALAWRVSTCAIVGVVASRVVFDIWWSRRETHAT